MAGDTGLNAPRQDNRSSSVFSNDGTYRYRLRWTWDAEKPTLAFLMLNPSTADESEDDSTIRRCLDYENEWGYATLLVGNLFVLRSTDPSWLRVHPEPVGPENDHHLSAIAESADGIIAAWGTGGALHDRGVEVAKMLDKDLAALNITKEGHPNHPLYQSKDAEPERWAWRAVR